MAHLKPAASTPSTTRSTSPRPLKGTVSRHIGHFSYRWENLGHDKTAVLFYKCSCFSYSAMGVHFFLDLIAEVKRRYKITGSHISLLQESLNILGFFSYIRPCFLYIFKTLLIITLSYWVLWPRFELTLRESKTRELSCIYIWRKIRLISHYCLHNLYFMHTILHQLRHYICLLPEARVGNYENRLGNTQCVDHRSNLRKKKEFSWYNCNFYPLISNFCIIHVT